MKNDTLDILPPLDWPVWVTVVFSIQNIIGIPIALIGNVFIICGSLKRANIFSKSFSSVMIHLIQALAICDLSLIFTKWITDTVTIFVKEWIFGQLLCFFSGTFSHFLAILEFALLASISGYKLYTLVKPFQSRHTVTPPIIRAWILLLVVLCALFRFSTYIWGMRSIYIREMLTCEPADLHTQQKPWIQFAFAVVTMFAIIPLTIILVSNIAIIFVASRHASYGDSKSNSLKLPSKSALVTVSSISWLFVISVTPVFVRIILEKLGHGPLPNWYLVLQKQMFWLNVMFNPVCYSLSCRHFKDHLIGTLSCGDSDKNIFVKIRGSKRKTPSLEVAGSISPALQRQPPQVDLRYVRGGRAKSELLLYCRNYPPSLPVANRAGCPKSCDMRRKIYS